MEDEEDDEDGDDTAAEAEFEDNHTDDDDPSGAGLSVSQPTLSVSPASNADTTFLPSNGTTPPDSTPKRRRTRSQRQAMSSAGLKEFRKQQKRAKQAVGTLTKPRSRNGWPCVVQDGHVDLRSFEQMVDVSTCCFISRNNFFSL